VTAGLLLQAAAYLAGLSAITLLQEALMGTPIDPIAVFPGFVIGAVSLAFIAFFVRGANAAEMAAAAAGGIASLAPSARTR
jgi:hypothetical protein